MRRVKILLKEVRIHGRGGQGVVTTAQLLAYAAFIEGKYVQAFPFYGAERRGAPLKAFVRISDSPILIHSQIYYPDYVVVLDPQIENIVDVTQGLKKVGLILINSPKKPGELRFQGWRVATVDATEIALELDLCVAGLPVVNTAILGAFAGASKEIGLNSVLKAIREAWKGIASEKNIQAAELAYKRLIKGW